MDKFLEYLKSILTETNYSDAECIALGMTLDDKLYTFQATFAVTHKGDSEYWISSNYVDTTFKVPVGVMSQFSKILLTRKITQGILIDLEKAQQGTVTVH